MTVVGKITGVEVISDRIINRRLCHNVEKTSTVVEAVPLSHKRHVLNYALNKFLEMQQSGAVRITSPTTDLQTVRPFVPPEFVVETVFEKTS